MRRPISLVIALIAAFVTVIPAFAQTPPASPAATPETQPYTGLIAGVSRQYTENPKQSPAEHPESFILISAHLFRFDSPADAASTWAQLTDDATTPIPGMQWDDEAGPKIHQGAINDLGDQAYAVWLSATTAEGDTGAFRLLYVQDDEYLIIVSAMGGSEDSTLFADDIARAITERDAGDGAPTVAADGTSTGDIWDKLPRTGDDAVHGLTAFADQESAVP